MECPESPPNGWRVADIALCAYTHVAGQAGFDLAAYSAVGAWLARVADQPGHVPMEPAPEEIVDPTDRSRPRTAHRRGRCRSYGGPQNGPPPVNRSFPCP